MERLQPKLRFPEFKDKWNTYKISDIGLVITGTTPSTSVKEYYDGNNLFLSPADIDESRFVNTTKTTLSDLGFKKTRKLKANSIAFVCIGSTIGKIAQVKKEFSTNQQINSIELNQGFNEGFSYYALLKRSQKIKLMAGVQTMPQINKTDFSKIRVSIPSIEEQTKIAEFLGSVDKQLELLNTKKEKLTLYKKGVMQQLFSQKLRFKDENGNDYPEWEKKTLGEVALKAKYGLNSSAINYDGINGYLRITDIDENSNKFISKGITSPEKFSNEFLLEEGDLLFARTGNSTGKSYLYSNTDGRLYFAGFLIRFRLKPHNSYKFIFYQTKLESFKKWVNVMSTRSGQPGINSEEYSSYKLQIPSLEEQTKIANFLSAIDQQILTIDQSITRTEQYKKGLLQQMFV